MLILLGTTITASFFDSLNPSAIAQQMLLQAMVKNKRQVWFFILGIGSANLIMGLAIYYGVSAWVARMLMGIIAAYPLYVYGTAVVLGLVCMATGICLMVRTRRGLTARTGGESDMGAVKVPDRLSPLSLFVMGVAFCAVELTSAFPYFGFLAVLTSYDPAFLLVLIYTYL